MSKREPYDREPESISWGVVGYVGTLLVAMQFEFLQLRSIVFVSL